MFPSPSVKAPYFGEARRNSGARNSIGGRKGSDSNIVYQNPVVFVVNPNTENIQNIQLDETKRVLNDVLTDVRASFPELSLVDVDSSNILNMILKLKECIDKVVYQNKNLLSTLESNEKYVHQTKQQCSNAVRSLEDKIQEMNHKINSNDSIIFDIRLKYEDEIKQLQNKLQNEGIKLADAYHRNNELSEQIGELNTELLETNRKEEVYLREAKAIINNNNIEVSMKVREMNKNQEELKALSYWRSKCQSLEKHIIEMNKVNNNLKKQLFRKGCIVCTSNEDKPLKHNTSLEVLEKEILQLRSDNNKLRAKYTTLSRKLALARAYPMLHYDCNEDEEEKDFIDNDEMVGNEYDYDNEEGGNAYDDELIMEERRRRNIEAKRKELQDAITKVEISSRKNKKINFK